MDAVRDLHQLPFEPGSTHLRADVQARLAQTRVRVWIDQDLCTGDGLCTDHAPAVFTILEDGIAYCREGDETLNDPGGAVQLALVPVAQEANVIHAAAECPGECIFIELDDQPAIEA